MKVFILIFHYTNCLINYIYHPDGLILVTGLELPGKRLERVYSQDNPIVWAKKATHSKIRFAVHDGEQTHSYKQEFEIGEVFQARQRQMPSVGVYLGHRGQFPGFLS